MLAKFNDGVKDLPLEQINKENYIHEDKSGRYVHAVIEVKAYSPVDGRKISSPQLQFFDLAMVKRGLLENLKKQGYTVNVVFDPREKAVSRETETNNETKKRKNN
ncbi:MAG: hypothetical protein IKQ46_12305 [Bacteroidales bacterium]|nr:hypothetical protein [Bacteroidales bacterium]